MLPEWWCWNLHKSNNGKDGSEGKEGENTGGGHVKRWDHDLCKVLKFLIGMINHCVMHKMS